jgi:hypothetical protein
MGKHPTNANIEGIGGFSPEIFINKNRRVQFSNAPL